MSTASVTLLSEELLRKRLPVFLARQRWFGGKARNIGAVDILDIIPVRDDRVSAELVLASVHYADHYPDETYCIPLLSVPKTPARSDPSNRTLASVTSQAAWTLQDALAEPDFLRLFLRAIAQGLIFSGRNGKVLATPTSAFGRLGGSSADDLRPTLLKGEQSNSSVIFEDRFILKLLRQVREGINPELEIGTFLTERARGARVPPVAGSIVYYGRDAAPRTLGILQLFVPNQGNAWDYTLRALADYSVRVAKAAGLEVVPALPDAPPPLRDEEPQPGARALFGSYLSATELLGRRTAELHLALSSDSNDPSFAPEPFTAPYRLALQRSMMEQGARVFELLRGQLSNLSESARPQAQALLRLQRTVAERVLSLLEVSLDGTRLRIHGDYHLGQVLCSDGDFTIIDFEGEPARPLAERRMKHSPLQDVAGMLRSFHYAARQGTRDWLQQQGRDLDRLSDSEEWIRFWRYWVASRFMSAYLKTSGNGSFLPTSAHVTAALLNIYLLNKVIYELEYELNNRPNWVVIPLEGILEILSPAR